ncbi:conserved hypothetical protein [Flavobacterium sp. 9AF]|uniref:hypothetical protein n=1 Tax=Flavobacterium sp. 9AF TaxID=2653142 RepID=UPI0012F1C712|nr:hypothetical protein [Flavobacterium sp. 9AF]VXB07832.1 conserved hypothetical protein [Flavobacterium sp. 9AF]
MLFIIQQIKKDKELENQVSYSDEVYKENLSSNSRNEWYVGGNLHRSKIEEWKSATDENKMATCADFIMKMKPNISINEAKSHALNLKNCIDEATYGSDYTNDEKVTQIAATCAIILGYN